MNAGSESRSAAGAVLQNSWHGKSRVRVAKVNRNGTHHRFTEFIVEVVLVGGSAASFTSGDNRRVVATDTCKNHVYVLAKTHPCDNPETFALDLTARFLCLYLWLDEARVTVVERPWRRTSVAGQPHSHGFELAADGSRFARLKLARGRNGQSESAQLVSGLKE